MDKKTAQEKLLDYIYNGKIDFGVLLDNIIWIERLTSDMVDNVKSWDEDLCQNVLEDIEENL